MARYLKTIALVVLTLCSFDSAWAASTASLSVTTHGNEAGAVDVVFTVTFDTANDTGSAITFDFNTADNTATAGSDYTAISGGTVSVADGASTGTITVTVLDDSLLESTETVDGTISNPPPGITIIAASATANIADNDTATASLSATTNGDETGPVNIVYTVTLSRTNNTGSAITFGFDTIGGTATAGSDYTAISGGTISVADGASTGTISVVALNDSLLESTETVVGMILGASSPSIIITTSTASANILDDDTATASLAATTSGSEAGPVNIQYTVTLSRTNNTGSAITFDFDTADGTATAGSDYTAISGGTLSISDGASTGTISVTVLDDSFLESAETVDGTISNSSNPAVTISTATANGSISDNETATASLSATVSGDEDGPVSIQYTVTLSETNNTGSPIAFDFNTSDGTATAGSDYTAISGGTVSVADGASTGTISATVLDDSLLESSETVDGTISNPSNASISISTATAVGTIVDDESATASLSATTNGDETGPVNIVYTVTLSRTNNTGSAITFDFDTADGTATAGSDYTAISSGTVSVADGASTGTISVTVLDDSLLESSETVDGTISNPSNASISISTATAVGTILDDESATASLSATTNGDETGPVNIVYTVTLSRTNSTGSAITFDFDTADITATAGSDYTAVVGGIVSIAEGATTGTLAVTVSDDALFENTETVEATISNASNAAISISTATATATITDNDNGAGSIDADLAVTTHGNETGPVSIVYTVTLAAVNNTHATISFDIDPTGGTATVDNDYTDFAGSTISVADGASTGTLAITVTDDTLFENTETVEASISNASDAAININTAAATADIIDSDNTAGSIDADLSVTAHGNETGTVSIVYAVTLAQENHTGSAITFDIDPTGGTASAGSDYTDFTGSTLSVAEGAATASITVAVSEDLLFENTETVQATISNASDAAININTAAAVATITDNDNGAGSIDVDLSVTTHGNETGPVSVVYTVTLAAANNTHGAISFDIDPTSGTAAAGSDFSDFAGATISVADGASTGTFAVTIVDDALFENDETLEATISNASDAAMNIDTAAATATITDNDNAAGSVAVSLSVSTHGKEKGTVSVVFSASLALANNTGGDITFDIDDVGGTATVTADYGAFSGTTLTIPDGSSSVQLAVTVAEDDLFENTETITAELSGASDPALNLSAASTTANIIDSDNVLGSIAATLTGTTNGNEAGPVNLVYTVTLDTVNNTGSAITFNIDPTGGTATAGADYTDFSGAGTLLSVANGASTGTLTVAVTDDSLFENTETVEATISSPSDPAINIVSGVASRSITDNDNSNVDASIAVTSNGDEEGPASIEYTVTLGKENNTGSPITFTVNSTGGTATSVLDYSDFDDWVISVNDGSSTAVLSVAVNDDSLFENDETVIAQISNPSDGAVVIGTSSATAEIADNDNGAGTISAVLTAASVVSETSPSSITYTVTLAEFNNTGAAITFSLDPSGGTATEGDDYTAFSGTTVSIADGAKSATHVVAVTDDTLFENNESLTAELTNSSDPAISITASSVTTTIEDDDNGNASITAALSSPTDGEEEGTVPLVFRVTLSKENHTGSPIDFTIVQTSATATAGSDYTAFSGGTISVPHGSATGDLNVAVMDDVLFENSEAIYVQIYGQSDPAIQVTASTATGIIVDNDNGAGSIDAALSVTTHGDETGPVSMVYTATLSKANHTGDSIGFSINHTGGTSTAGADFVSYGTGTLYVGTGTTTGTYTVRINDDDVFEGTETAQATISSPSDAAIAISTASATANITDNDLGVTADLSTIRDGDENGPVSIRYRVTLSEVNNTGSSVTFNIDPTGGTATAGADYSDFSGTQISVQPGRTTGRKSVTVIDDPDVEGVETVIATISSPSHPSISIGTASATANINEDETVPATLYASLSVGTQGAEDGPVAAEYVVTLSAMNDTGSDVTFDIDPSGGSAAAGSDYTNFAGSTITVAAGATTGTLSVPITDDTLFENTETISATISNPSNPGRVSILKANASAFLIDNDNDHGSIGITFTEIQSGDETGPVDLIFQLTLSTVNNTGVPITFNIDPYGGYAVADTDYADFSGSTISIPNGSDTGTFTVSVLDDTLFDNTKSLSAILSNPSDSAISMQSSTIIAVGYIADNDNAAGSVDAELTVSQHGAENGPVDLVFELSLSKQNDTADYMLYDIARTDGSAVQGSDYLALPATCIKVYPGNSTGTYTVRVADDGVFENTETLQMTISNPSDPALNTVTDTAVGNIIDDDNAAGSIDVDLSATRAGAEDGTVAVEYTVAMSTPNYSSSGAITFDIGPSGGNATVVDDYTDFSGSTISIPYGSAFGTLTVAVVDDSLFENDETVLATISSPSDPAMNIATASATGTIIDDDNAPNSIGAVISVDTHGDEDGPVAIVYDVTLAKVNNTHTAITFSLEPSGGRATADSDYTDFSGSTLSIPHGSNSATLTVTVLEDTLFENTETVQGTVGASSDAAVYSQQAMVEADIADNDNAVGSITADLSVTTHGNETGPVAIEYTVTMTEANHTGTALSFDIDPTGGSASAGSDYFDFTGGTISVPHGSATGTLTISVTDDSLFENDETVEATISNSPDPAVVIGNAAAVAVITDNNNATDGVDAELAVTTNGNEEGTVSIVYTVTLATANNTNTPITFSIDPGSGNADADDDYTDFSGGTISVAHGSSTGTFAVAVVDDGLFEHNEWIQAIISSPSDSAVTIITASATATIIDNDNGAGAVDADLSVTTHGSEEGSVSIVYTVTLGNTNNTHGAITFDIDPSGGTATAGSDYTDYSGSTISIADGSATGTLTVSVSDDSLFENTETAEATISNASDSAINISTAAIAANITDNDNAAGSVDADLSVTTHGDEDGPTAVMYTVMLSTTNNTHSAITFDIDPSGGTASATADYTNFAGASISVPHGAATGTYSVAVVDDSLFENTETLQATISNASDAAISIGTASATANIVDNDNGAGSINADLSVSTHGDEDGPVAIVYTVTLSNANNTHGAVTVDIDPSGGTATATSDYTDFAGGAITIAHGSATGTLSVAVSDDALFENSETVQATISNASDSAVTLNTPTATANIADNDNAAGSIDADLSVTTHGEETGPVSIVYTVTLAATNNTHGAIAFDIDPTDGTAAAGSDYTDFAGASISVPDGSATGTYSVVVVDDSLFENTETVEATISNASDAAISIATAAATANIADNNNSAGSVDADLSATTHGDEDGPVSIVYTVTISTVNNTGAPITFDIDPSGGTAAATADYADFSGSTITVADGATTGTINVSVVDDALFENTETLQASISNASDAAINLNTPSATANISDNDNAAGSIDADLSVSTHGNETGPVSVVYTITIAAVNNTHGDITFDIDPSGGTASAGSDCTDFSGSTVSITDGASTATFTVLVADDALFENTETLQATISSATDSAININTASAIANITDNDNGAGSIDAGLSVTTDGDEDGPQSIEYTVTLANANNTHSAITFDIDPSGGTATVTADYTDFAGASISVPHGSATGTYSVVVVDDALFENTETVQATIANPSDAAVSVSTASSSGNIIDNDNGAGSVDADLSVTTHGDEDGPVSIVYTVTIDTVNNTGVPITFDIDPSGGTAAADSDYTDFAGSSISIADGASTTTLTVVVLEDALFENTETLQATISNASDAAVNLNTPSATADISDNDNGAGSIDADLSVTTHGDEDGPVSVVYTVTLSEINNTHGAISFDIDPSGGTASAGSDYTDFAGASISVAHGSAAGTYTVAVADDALFENTETMQATISNSSDAAVSINTAAAAANITDNDNGAGSIDADLSVTTHGDEDGPQSIEYTVTLANANNTHSAITFDIDPSGGTAAAAADYSNFAGATISVPHGSATGTFSVAVVDDSLFENTETVQATIANPSDAAVTVATASSTANIADNDNGAGSIDADLSVTTHGDEDGPVSIVYTVAIGTTNNTGSAITFDIDPSSGTAAAGNDYSDFAGSTISVADGASTAALTVVVLEDTLFENTETLEATISNASDAAINLNTPSATADIADNDNGAGSIDADLSVTTDGDEDGPVSIVYTVTLSEVNNTHGSITFDIDPTDGTAAAGSDYTNFAGASISVPDGSAAGTYSVVIIDDSLFENTETVEATISNASDAAISIDTAAATANIIDNDNGVGSIDADLSVTTHGDEDGPVTIVYTVTLGTVNNTGAAITFDIDPSGGTAAAPADYADFSGSTITVADGAATGTIAVPVVDDALFENTETLQATISNASDAAINLNTPSATANISDNDNGAGSIDADLSVTTHGDETGPVSIVYTVTLALTNNTHGAIAFDIDPSGGTAAAGSDFTDFSGSTVSVADGASTATFTISVTDDALFENTETLRATISSATDAAININTAAATANITDNDNAAGSIDADLSVTTHGDEDGPQSIEYTVTLGNANNTHSAVSFDIDPSGGTAGAVDDYANFAGATISVPHGSTTGTYLVAVVDDALFENTETVQATISNATDAAVNLNTPSAEANITDNDNAAGSIDADLSVTTHGDEDGPVSIVYTVALGTTNNTGAAITFDIDPSGGTATAGSDYTDFAGSTVSIADGAATAALTVVVLEDSLFENTETLQATISNASDAAINLNTPSATADIADNDNSPGSINADLSVTTHGSEVGPVSIVYTVTIAEVNNTGSAITFDIDPSGGTAAAVSDYVDFSGSSAVITDGASTATVTVVVVDDALFENTETLQATISNASDPGINISTPSATANITDNDNGAASIDADLSVSIHGDEDGPQSIEYTVTLAAVNNTHGAVSFDIDPVGGTAAATDDYTNFTGASISVPHGSATGTYSVVVVDDSLFENSETVQAAVSNPSDAAVSINTASATASIADNDNSAGSVDADLSVTTHGDETGTVSIVYTVTIAAVNDTGVPITFDIDPSGGTAAAGSDYTDFAGSTVSIADGASTAALTVVVLEDSLFENTETLQATISNASDAAINLNTPSATADILDNDNGAGSYTAVLAATADGNEQGPVGIEYTVTLTTTNYTHGPITFDIDPSGGTAVAGADYDSFAGDSISVPHGSSSGTFTVPVTDDSLLESIETVQATISSSSDSAVVIGAASAVANIYDNDSLPGTVDADLSVTTHGDENGAVSIVYTVTLANTNNTASAITFNIDPSGGTAAIGDDYLDFAGSQISVATGSSTGSLSVSVVDDSLFENSETVQATISSPSNGAININTASAAANIADDDNAAGSIDADLTVTAHGNEEGPVSVEYTVTIAAENNTGSPLTFDIDPTGGTATAGDDYTDFSAGTISVADGASTGTLIVAVVDDSLFENEETIQATISNPSDPALSISTAAATANVADNDNGAGTINVDLSVTTHGDESGPVSIEYTLTLASTNNTHGDITFDINPSGGTAAATSDYTDFSGSTVAIGHGAATAVFTVSVVDDALFENTETVQATITNASDAAIVIGTASATADIIDNNNGTGSIDADVSIVSNGDEDGPTPIELQVAIATANHTGSPITFDISTSGGTAASGVDYTDISGSEISIPDGASQGSMTIPVVDDELIEVLETADFVISSPSDPAIAIATAADTANIQDNDDAAGSVDADLSVSFHGNEEGTIGIQYRVMLSKTNGTGSPITFDLSPTTGSADAGLDYVDFTGSTISVPDGRSFGTLDVVVLEDTLFENTETISAEISNPSNTAIAIRTAETTAQIADNDAAAGTISLTLSLISQGAESGPVPLVMEASLGKANHTHSPITFTIAATGGTAAETRDYTAFSGTELSIPHGSQSVQLTVGIIDDDILENDESVVVTLSSPSDPAIQTPSQALVTTILDDERLAEDDGDGLPNGDECPLGEAACPDSDGDGILDPQDSDDDGDGIPTSVECSDASNCPDSDGDGLPDYLENNYLDTDDDGLFDHQDADDDDDGVPTGTEAGGLSGVKDSDNDGIPDHLDRDDSGSESGDSDDDGLSDAEECPTGYICADSDNDGTPDYMQPAEILQSPFYTIWNSFFGQSNVLALANTSSEVLHITASLLNNNGELLGSQDLTLAANQEFDLLIDEIASYPASSYGLVQIDFDQPQAVEGYSAGYKTALFNPESMLVGQVKMQFGILRPFNNARRGESFAFFNTYQPSYNPLESNFVVPHWIQIGNVDPNDTKRFTVIKYDRNGSQIDSVRVSIPPKGRRDVEGGHHIPGPSSVGLIRIIPDDLGTDYIAQVFHYGYNSEAATKPDSFSFAMGERCRRGSSRPQYLNVTNGADAKNWLTIANVGDSQETVNLTIISNQGTELFNQDIQLNSRQQQHISVTDILPHNYSGLAVVTPSNTGRIISNSRLYYHNQHGSITTASLLEGRTALGSDLYSLYNTFFDQFNWLSVFNVSDQRLAIEIFTYNQQGQQISSIPMELGAKAGLDAELMHSLGVYLNDNSYGAIRIVPSRPGTLYSVIRRFKLGDIYDDVDLAKPLPLR